MKLICCKYVLRNGASGTLLIVARSSVDAIVCVDEIFGLALRGCSARPA